MQRGRGLVADFVAAGVQLCGEPFLGQLRGGQALFESTSIGRWPPNLQKQGAGGGGDDDVDDVVEMDAEDDGVMPDGAAGAGE